MVEPDNSERIERMEREGVISPEQAAILRQSLHSESQATSSPAKRRWQIQPALIWIGLGALLLAMIIASTMGGGDPPAIQDVSQTLNDPEGFGAMNRTFSTIVAVALLLIVPLLVFVYLYNSLVSKEETVSQSWAQTESNYQRRADLIPALVDTVSRYLQHERETLTTVTEERGGGTTRLNDAIAELIEAQNRTQGVLGTQAESLLEDEDALRRLFEAQSAVAQRMTNVFAVAEDYPELRSSDQFLQLQAQLEGTENRINVARMRFNNAVQDYNSTARMLPWSLVASMGNFQRKAYFQSDEEARNAPTLQFN